MSAEPGSGKYAAISRGVEPMEFIAHDPIECFGCTEKECPPERMMDLVSSLPIHPELLPTFRYASALQDLEDALNGRSDAPAATEIAQLVVQLGALLIKKNRAYGNSALNPLSVFSRNISTEEKLGVRIDDKLSRLARGNADGEDPEFDFLGYLILLLIARHQKEASRV